MDKLQRQWLPVSSLNAVMTILEKRGFKVEVVYNVLKISLRHVDTLANEDHLGLPKIEGDLKDLCDVIRESTSFGKRGGIDPRTQIYYSRRSSILQGSDLGDDALLTPNSLPTKGERKKHPLDLTSTEEVILRRQLADRRWQEQKKKQRNNANKKIENAKNFFEKGGKELTNQPSAGIFQLKVTYTSKGAQFIVSRYTTKQMTLYCCLLQMI